jgi:hypothetical protein
VIRTDWTDRRRIKDGDCSMAIRDWSQVYLSRRDLSALIVSDKLWNEIKFNPYAEVEVERV